MNDRDTLICALFLLATFAVQLAVLYATGKRFRPLRFAIPVLAGTAGMVFFLAAVLTAPSGWAALLWWLVLLFVFLGLGLVLVGYGLAWAVYYLIKRKKGPAYE